MYQVYKIKYELKDTESVLTLTRLKLLSIESFYIITPAIKNMLVMLMPTIRNATMHLIVFLVILSSIIENLGADNSAI